MNESNCIVYTQESLSKGRAVSRRYRNRRIGEFLKELELTEGRSTGIPKILRDNEFISRVGGTRGYWEIKAQLSPLDGSTEPTSKTSKLSKGLNAGLNSIVREIRDCPGIQLNELAKSLNRSARTLERPISELIKKNLIERRGSRKTGGYYLKEAKDGQ